MAAKLYYPVAEASTRPVAVTKLCWSGCRWQASRQQATPRNPPSDGNFMCVMCTWNLGTINKGILLGVSVMILVALSSTDVTAASC